MTDNTTKLQGTTTANVVTTSGGGNGPCDTASGWTAVTDDTDETDIASCLAACRKVNTDLLSGETATSWFEADASANGSGDWAATSNLGVDTDDSNSVLRMARWS